MQGTSKVSAILFGLRDIVLGLLGVGSVVLAIYLAYLDRVAAASVLFTAGILLTLLSRLHLFESIKGLGIEAKMVQKLDNKINEAEQLLDRIRGASALMARISFQLVPNLGRYSGPVSRSDSLSIAEDLVKQLEACGVPRHQIDEYRAPWVAMNVTDLALPLYKALRHSMDLKNQEIQQSIHRLHNSTAPPTPESEVLHNQVHAIGHWLSQLAEDFEGEPKRIIERFEGIVETMPFLPPFERTALLESQHLQLEQARHYLQHGDFKNREEWLRGGDEQ